MERRLASGIAAPVSLDRLAAYGKKKRKEDDGDEDE